jgi:hypothetical protein
MRTRSTARLPRAARRGRLLAGVALASLCFACSHGQSSPDGAGSSGTWLGLERSGGLAGGRTTLTVTSDGELTVLRDAGQPARRRLPQAELEQLRTQADQAGFKTLQPTYTNPSARDAFTYRITYAGQSLECQDGTAPASVRPLLASLTALLRTTPA